MRSAGGVAFHDPYRAAGADEIPLAVDQHPVGDQAEAIDRPPGCQPLRR